MAPETAFWLRPLRIYFAVVALGNLAWEALQLPLYTIWTLGQLAFAVVHCTGGDLLIAICALAFGLIFVGERGFWPVAALAIAFGLAYAGFSEWLNVYVRGSWAYSQSMPVLALGAYKIGLSPILQWIVVPSVALWAAGRTLTPR